MEFSVSSKTMIKKRCNNFEVLDKGLNGLKGVYSICNPLVKGICPFSYPVRVEGDRDRVQAELAGRGVYCPILLTLPDGTAGVCGESLCIADSMLSIPCDQRYEQEDMAYIIDVMRNIILQQ